jgi:hypothetical protein
MVRASYDNRLKVAKDSAGRLIPVMLTGIEQPGGLTSGY